MHMRCLFDLSFKKYQGVRVSRAGSCAVDLHWLSGWNYPPAKFCCAEILGKPLACSVNYSIGEGGGGTLIRWTSLEFGSPGQNHCAQSSRSLSNSQL